MRLFSLFALVPVCLALVVSACGGDSGTAIDAVEHGMTKKEVRDIMGEPDDVHRDPGSPETEDLDLECWSWEELLEKPRVICFMRGEVIDIRGESTTEGDTGTSSDRE